MARLCAGRTANRTFFSSCSLTVEGVGWRPDLELKVGDQSEDVFVTHFQRFGKSGDDESDGWFQCGRGTEDFQDISVY